MEDQNLQVRKLHNTSRKNKVKNAKIVCPVEVALDLGGADSVVKEIKKFYGR